MSSSTERQNMIAPALPRFLPDGITPTHSNNDLQNVLAGLVNDYNTTFHDNFKKVMSVVTDRYRIDCQCGCGFRYEGTFEQLERNYEYFSIDDCQPYMRCPNQGGFQGFSECSFEHMFKGMDCNCGCECDDHDSDSDSD